MSVRQADIFSVWGVPPHTVLQGMTAHQIKLLKSYVKGTTEQAYRIGYDNGGVDALEECARICEAIRGLALNKAEG